MHLGTKGQRPRGTSVLPLEPCRQLSPARPRASAPALHFTQESSFFVPNSSPPDLEPTTPPCSVSAHIHALTYDDSAAAEKEIRQSNLLAVTEGHDASEDTALGQFTLAPSSEVTDVEVTPHPESTIRPVPSTSHTIKLTRSAPRRPLKSLVSMLDNFREIARSATQKPPSTQSRSRTANPARHLASLPGQSRLITALRSDDSSSLRRLRERVTLAMSTRPV